MPTVAPTTGPTASATAVPAATATLAPTFTAVPTLEPTATPAPLLHSNSAPTVALPSSLPETVPGLSRDEGVFLVTAADDGSRAVYFIADGSRHSILSADMQLEVQRNPLWPARSASREELLAYPEGAPIGSAKVGLLSGPVVSAEPLVEAPAAEPIAQPAVEAPAPQTPVEAPAPQPAVEAAAPKPVVAAPAASTSLDLPEPSTPIELPSAQPTIYVLKPGDNLTRLSAQYGTTVEAILAANGLSNANRIFWGLPLVIPAPGSEPAPDVVETPAAPAPIADDVAPPVADITSADLPADATAPTASSYTVGRGDSAVGIARKFNIDVEDLLAANGIANRNLVYVGQVLAIPE